MHESVTTDKSNVTTDTLQRLKCTNAQQPLLLTLMSVMRGWPLKRAARVAIRGHQETVTTDMSDVLTGVSNVSDVLLLDSQTGRWGRTS